MKVNVPISSGQTAKYQVKKIIVGVSEDWQGNC